MLNNTKQTKKSLSTRSLSLIILAIGVFLSLVLFKPLALVFSGEWKVHQKIDIATRVTIDFNTFGLGGLMRSLGLEDVIPVGTVSLRYYALALLLGILSGYFLTLFLSKKHYIASTTIDRLVIGLITSGIIGARLFFVVFNWSFYMKSPLNIITEILSGGLAFFGMFLFSFAYIWIYTSRFKFSLFEFLDFISPGLLLGQVIGRWGNFFNYESYGPETSVFWKMAVPDTANYYDLNANYFHPTFLYEIIPNFILLVLILFWYDALTVKRSGLVFAFYAMGYGLIRFITEFFRLDALKIELPKSLQLSLGYFGNLEFIRVSQVMSLLLFVFGLSILIKRLKVIYLKKNMMEYSTY
jgi:phosphatidylglycerol:prolipoprotein diacylglycerol transferase